MELDGAVRRKVENPLRDDNRDKGQHVEVRSQVLVGLEELAAAQVFGLVCGDALLLGQVEQGVSLALVEHPNHVFALLQESPVDRLAKGCLSNESHSHFTPPDYGRLRCIMNAKVSWGKFPREASRPYGSTSSPRTGRGA